MNVCIPFLLLLLSMPKAFAQEIDISSLSVHQDQEHGFSIRYPSDWTTGLEQQPGTCFKAEYQEGRSWASVNVVCIPLPEDEEVDSEEAALRFSNPEGMETLRQAYERQGGHGLDILYYSTTTLGQTPALLIISELTKEGPFGPEPVRMVQTIASVRGMSFTLTASAPKDDFLSMLPLFEHIAGTFARHANVDIAR